MLNKLSVIDESVVSTILELLKQFFTAVKSRVRFPQLTSISSTDDSKTTQFFGAYQVL